jgi:peptidoglycan/LPS O-acetylase OafA/YrhL
MKRSSFRKDINGLRAIGVIAVIVFHFNAAWLPGGFAGVDIFFVISGYLMTKLVVTGLVTKEFSLTRFYFSRVRRIVPALAVLCFTLLILGWFTLAPSDYAHLARHIEKCVTFT